MNTKIAEQIKKLELEKSQLEARRKNLIARNKQEETKYQNRRKDILGSLMFKSIEENDGAKNHVVMLLLKLTDKDKKYFVDLLAESK
jgi:hypothetical protein